MKRAYGLTGDYRKQMVAIIGEVTGTKSEYLRMPSCAYAIGGITVTKDGTMIWDGRTPISIIDRINAMLREAGLIIVEEQSGSTEVEQTVIKGEDVSVPAEVENPMIADIQAESSPETTGLIISFPLDGGSSGEPITETVLQNLEKIIASKATLIKKALNADQLTITTTEKQISFPCWKYHV